MNSLKAMNEKAEAVEAELKEKVEALSDREQEELLEKLKEEMK